MDVAGSIEAVRSKVGAARRRGERIGLVPTMGALHAGHMSLIETARRSCEYVVVSIFVNPTQFGAGEDLAKYPRSLESDLAMCEESGVDVVFAPSVEEMYGSENLTWVTVEKLTGALCGRFRPGHFRGVTTVCAKLFNIVWADVAFFGQKDAQQAIVIKRMVSDLNMPLEIVVCPTVREASGLAVSSRNKYLGEHEREEAALIYESLRKCREMVESGVDEVKAIIEAMREVLGKSPDIKIEYVEIVDAESLERLERVRGRVLAAAAVRLGAARLIDNIVVDAGRE